jgi:hypothetical protein
VKPGLHPFLMAIHNSLENRLLNKMTVPLIHF